MMCWRAVAVVVVASMLLLLLLLLAAVFQVFWHVHVRAPGHV